MNTINVDTSESERSFGEPDFKNRLIDEYKILQDKIDKIGGFRFTIKGWSVTALIAASAATSTSARLSTILVISFGLAVLLVFFFIFEFQQVRLSRIFGERARKIEECFRLLDKGYGNRPIAQIRVPFTANEIVIAGIEQKLFRWRKVRGVKKVKKFPARLKNWWSVVTHADILFYLVLICMAFLLPLVPRHSQVGNSLYRWVDRPQVPIQPKESLERTSTIVTSPLKTTSRDLQPSSTEHP